MRFFHFSLIWGGTSKTPDQLRGILDLAEDWIFVGDSFYVIYTSESLYTWQSRFIAIIGENDSFFISELSNVQYSTAGFMSGVFWEWLRRNRSLPNVLSPSESSTPFPRLPPVK